MPANSKRPGSDRSRVEPPGGGRFKGKLVGDGAHQARLRYMVSWRDNTHGTDSSNLPGDYQRDGRRGEHADSQNFQPYKGVSTKAKPERTDDEEST